MFAKKIKIKVLQGLTDTGTIIDCVIDMLHKTTNAILCHS